MTGKSGSGDDEPAWHERTSTVVGASAAALAAVGLLWLVISWMAGGSDDPGPAQYYLEPSVSGSSTAPSTTTTSTETITSTSPPVTTDINPGDTTTTSSTDTTSTSTSPGETTPPRTRRSTTDGDGSSTRQRPRLNETRTLYPRP
ncbi:hypothetical protein TUM20985_52420 [Mycobacterium antarcticum]|uniref:hypothetical protein n=1 Tax=Mycolicibacterium sp. TUM20985 TaxID=3023370 RepID=UPI002574273D|nr:hypothetical protein [Mycolicibacterium sp. TUM20985]BDX34695.1 hypothetical protein TUM20985_52420 [Mycolicibacterium sp. TUM20985]